MAKFGPAPAPTSSEVVQNGCKMILTTLYENSLIWKQGGVTPPHNLCSPMTCQAPLYVAFRFFKLPMPRYLCGLKAEARGRATSVPADFCSFGGSCFTVSPNLDIPTSIKVPRSALGFFKIDIWGDFCFHNRGSLLFILLYGNFFFKAADFLKCVMETDVRW